MLNHQRRVLRAKFHNLRVTACWLEHDGLLLLPPALIEAAGLAVYDEVAVASCAGQRRETYALPASIPEGGSVDLPVVLAGLYAPDSSGVRALFIAPVGVRDSELADRATGRVMARWLWCGRPAGGRSGFVCGCTLS